MTIRENYVAVGVDGSEHAAAAALWAAAEAHRRGADLMLVNAYTDPMSLYAGDLALPDNSFQDAHDWAEAVLATVRAEVEKLYPTMVITGLIRHAHPVTALLDIAEHALLTVVGTAGGHRLSGFLLGSVAARIAGHAAGPVVVVPGPGAATSDGSVVVGIDGSDASGYALAFAFEEASMRGADLVAVRVWDDSVFDSFAKTYPVPVHRESIDEAETLMLAEQLAGWSEKYPDVRVRRMVRGGSAGPVLLEECIDLRRSRGAALLVVGSRGRGGFTGMLLGSTSQSLITHAPCPVAVVRAGHRS